MIMPGLVDSHLHLHDYGSAVDIGNVLEAARAAGVSRFVCCGTSEEDWDAVLLTAKSHPDVVPCFGLHPWFVDGRSPKWLKKLEDFIRRCPSGVGEAGLDRAKESLDRSVYEEVLRLQLDLARRYNRPVMLHCVRAWGQLMDVLRSEPDLPAGMLIHAYSGSADMVKPLASLGAYFTFSPAVLKDGYKRAREALQVVPKDRLLLESDAPLYHPAGLPDVLKGIAHLLNEDSEALQYAVWENSQRFLAPLLNAAGEQA